MQVYALTSTRYKGEINLKTIRAFAACLLVAASMSAIAQPKPTPVTDLKVGSTVSVNVIDFGTGPAIPLPPGQTWKVIANFDFDHQASRAITWVMNRLTLLNADKESSVPIVTIAALTRWRDSPSPASADACYHQLGVLKMSYPNLGPKSSSCSVAETVMDLESHLGELESILTDSASRGLLTGLVKPLKQDPDMRVRLGKNPLFLTNNGVRWNKQAVFYTLAVRNDTNYKPSTVPAIDAELSAWMRQYFGALQTYMDVDDSPKPIAFPALRPLVTTYTGPLVEVGLPISDFDTSVLSKSALPYFEKARTSSQVSLTPEGNICWSNGENGHARNWILVPLMDIPPICKQWIPLIYNGRYFPKETRRMAAP
ncbi:MAG: hypothetical protein ACOVOD_15270 [Rhodoferax sp.]